MSKERRITSILNDSFDDVSQLIVTLPGEHSRIHSGYAFKVFFDVGVLAQGTQVTYSFKTPENLQIHLQSAAIGAANADVAIDFIRGTPANPLIIDNPGDNDVSIMGPHNLNDVLNYPSKSIIKKNPTYVDGNEGELWDRLTLPGTGSNQYQSVGIRVDSPFEEYLMKENTYYIFKIRNTDSTNGANGVFVRMFWYGRAPV